MIPIAASSPQNAPRPDRGPAARARTAVASLALLVAALVAGASSAPAARASDYTVSYCRDPGGAPITLQDWVPEELGGNTTGATNEGCATGNPLQLMAVAWDATVPRQPGMRLGWILRAVGGNRIVQWTAISQMSIHGSSTYGEMSGVAGCEHDCGLDGTPAFGGTVGMDRDSLEFFVACRAPAGSTCNNSGGGSDIRLYTNQVTFRDPAAPALSGAVGGSFVGGLPVSGTVDATAAATDAGSGVRHIGLVVDGREVASSADRCTPPYDRQQPCPAAGDGTPRLDTTTLSDGTHQAQVTGVDASGNTGVLWSGQLLVSNGPSRGPGTDVNLRGAPNGSYGADDARITAAWPTTGVERSSSKAVRRRCSASKSYARAHRVLCVGRAPVRSIATNFSATHANSVAGRLVTKAGAPIANAALRIVSTPRGGGAPAVVASPTTDATGRFTAKLAIKGGSSRISVDWLARARDTVPATAIGLRRTVRAATTFTASPRRTVRRGRTLTLRGTLRGVAGERSGNAIAVQANAGGGWRAVTTVRTGDTGRWKARYRVPLQLRGRYRFRAVVTPSTGYPYALGHSSSRTITVR